MPSQIETLVDGVLARELESLERRKHLLERKHEDKVLLAVNVAQGKAAPTSLFPNKAMAEAFLKQCSHKPGKAASILTAPLSDYQEWALANVEVVRTKLIRQKLLDRIKSEYALGRLKGM